MTKDNIMMAMAFTAQILVCIATLLPLKIKKKSILYFIPFVFLGYCGIVYFSNSDYLWWVAYILELSISMLLLYFCNYGNTIQNFVYIWIDFQITNVIFVLFSALLNLLHLKSSYILVYRGVDIIGMLAETIEVVVISYIVSTMIKKIIEKKKQKTYGMYRIFFWLILLIGTISGHIRDKKIKDYRNTHTLGTASDIFVYINILLVAILTINIIAYIFNRLEISRLEKIKDQFSTLHANKSKQYNELTKNNQKIISIKRKIEQYRHNLKDINERKTIEYLDELCVDEESMTLLPLSGFISVDAILSSFYRNYDAEGMIFEFHVEDLIKIKMAEIDVAVLIENLLKIAQIYSRKYKGKGWTLINTRNIGNNVVFKIEFSKNYEDELIKPKRFSIIKSVGKNENELRIIRKIIQLYNGILDVADMGEEAIISILI